MCKLAINHISMSLFVYIKCKQRTCELLDPVSFPSNVTPVCHISTATNIQSYPLGRERTSQDA